MFNEAMHGHGWQVWQWVVYGAVNWLIGACYLWIPWQLRHFKLIPDSPTRFLFKGFIAVCGLHHLAHPVVMYFTHNNLMFALLMFFDGPLMVISLLTVVYVQLGKHGTR